MMKFNDYLKSILTKKQYRDLKEAMSCGDVIIIKGEQGPTGKSTLKSVLRKNGFCAFEECELHYVELNTPLQAHIPRFDEQVGKEPWDLSKMLHRRFNPLKEDLSEFARVMNRGNLTKEDLKVILTSIELSEAGKKMIEEGLF